MARSAPGASTFTRLAPAPAGKPRASVDVVSSRPVRKPVVTARPVAEPGSVLAVLPAVSSPADPPAMTAAQVATAVSVKSAATGALGSELDSPLGWIAVRATRGQIGRSRRGVTGTSAATTIADAVAAPDVPVTPPFATDEVLVVWKPGMADFGRKLEMAILGASVIDLIGTQEMLQTQDGLVYRLKVPGGTAAAIRILSMMPGVALVEPNYRLSLQATSNDPYSVSYTHLTLPTIYSV